MSEIDVSEIQEEVMRNGYQIIDMISTGGFATVFKALHISCHKIFALKVIQVENDNDMSIATYINEILSLKKLIHPNIITIYKYFRDKHYLYIVLEYCPNGSLKDLLERKGALETQELISIGKQILASICYLHEKNISHGDIKPGNILFDEYKRPKLGDFGLAAMHKEKSNLVENFCCSPIYAPPEVLLKRPYDPYKADIWSYGVMIYQMALGHIGFKYHTIRELITIILTKETWIIPNPQVQHILNNTIQSDPEHRLSARALIRDPVFAVSMSNTVKQYRVESRSTDIKQLINRVEINPNEQNQMSNLSLVRLRPKLPSSKRNAQSQRNSFKIKSKSIGPPIVPTFIV